MGMMNPLEDMMQPFEDIGDESVTFNEEDNPEPVFQILYEIDEKEKDEVKDQFLKRLKSSQDFMDTLYPSMISNFKKYRSVADPIFDELGNEDTSRANLFIPYPHAIVEAEMPRLAGRLPKARAFPRFESQKIKTDAIQDMIYYSLDRMNFVQLQTMWLRQYEIYGWSPLYYYWRKEETVGLERVPQDLGQGTIAYPLKRVTKTKYDDFWATILDVFDCFFQPGVEQMEEGEFFFFREWVSAKELKRMAKDGLFYPEVSQYLKDNTSPAYNTGQDTVGRRERDEIEGLVPNSSENSYGKYELMWMLENNRIVQIIDRVIVARVGDNPNPLQEIPIINCNLCPLVSEPIGIGTIEALAGLPDKLNALSNARLDNISLLLNPVFLANRNDQQTDFKNIKSTGGNVILVGDVERSLKTLTIPDLSNSSEVEIRHTTQDMQVVSGVSDYIQGTKTSSKLVDTATGVATVVREGNAKFALKLSTFESGSLRKFIEVCHAYNMTYMPEKKRIHVTGVNGMALRDVTLDDILGECDFVVEPGSCIPLDQVSRREALMNLLDRVMKLPMIVRVDKYFREVMESFDIRNPEDFMVTQDGPKSATEDALIAEAENTALSQNMGVKLQGNDGLHLGVHQSADTQNWEQGAIMTMKSHIEQHQLKMQADMQKQQAALSGAGGMNGGIPNAGGPSPAPTGVGGQQGMGGPPGVSGLPQQAAL
jgi:hypothetical protein